MTSELKPCPFCNYKISMAEGICPSQDCKDEDTGKWNFTGICCPSCACFLPKQKDNSTVPDGVASWNTRPAPTDDPLAGLKRFAYSVTRKGGRKLEQNIHGEYVLHSEAAKIVAAKDADISEISNHLDCDADSDSILHTIREIEADKNIYKERAETAEAELAQIKAQSVNHYKCEGCDRVTSDPKEDMRKLKIVGHLSCCPERKMLPYYAAPISDSMKAENERLREALEKLLDAMPADTCLTDDELPAVGKARAALNVEASNDKK